MNIIKNKVFSGLSLQNQNLDGWLFYNCNFDKTDFRHGSFRSVKFLSCSYNRVSWEHSDLECTNFTNHDNFTEGADIEAEDDYSKFRQEYEEREKWPEAPLTVDSELQNINTGYLSSFRRCNLYKSKFIGQNINDSDFSEADLTSSSFLKCNLDHCCFSSIRYVGEHGNSDGQYVNDKILFGEEVSLEFANFSGTNLKGLIFHHCKSLEAADFSWADLKGAHFIGKSENEIICLYRSKFDNARLVDVIFENCDLDSSSFAGGDLRNIFFKGKTKANASNFSYSYMPGCRASGIEFRAANFSQALIGIVDDSKENYGASDFSNSDLISANFSYSALFAVNFDYAKLNNAIFDSAIFRAGSSENVDKSITLTETKFPKASFKNVWLEKYNFIDCEADGAIFDESDLKDVNFLGGKLSDSSFDECYLENIEFRPNNKKELKMENASFCSSDLKNAKFESILGRVSSFRGSNLENATFRGCDLYSSDFSNTNFDNAKINDCDLKATKFNIVSLNNSSFIDVDISLSEFVKVQGEKVTFRTKKLEQEELMYAVIFRNFKLAGNFKMELSGATVEQGQFHFYPNTKVIWHPGLQCNGSLFKLDSGNQNNLKQLTKMKVIGGLIGNSKIELLEKSELISQATTIESTAIQGLNDKSHIKDTTLESCTLHSGWESARFENANMDLTNFETNGKDLSEYRLDDIALFDRSSISALKQNAQSLGEYDNYDNFFSLEMQKRIDERKEKKSLLNLRLYIPFFILFSYPLIRNSLSYWNSINHQPLEFFVKFKLIIDVFVLFAPIAWAAYHVWSSALYTFLDWLYGYGNNLIRIGRTIFITVLLFSLAWFSNSSSHLVIYNFKNGKKFWDSVIEFVNLNMIPTFFESLQYSINTFVTIGYWNEIKPKGIMIWYSNFESLLGVLLMALLVVTIIRKSVGR